MIDSIAAALAGIAAHYKDRPQCEITTRAATRCRHPASRWADIHGCDQRLMCTQHWRDWHLRVENIVRINGRCTCVLCGRWFDSVEAVGRVIRL